MADRRMFSKAVINSAKFLRMPLTSQALYFHLGLNADDDGIVEAFPVLRMTGCNEDDLRILCSKGLISVLNDDLVAYITDWNANNKIRADRKVDSIYKDLLIKVIPDAQILESRPRADTGKPTGQPLKNNWTSSGQPMDGIGKDRIVEDRIVEESISESKDSSCSEQSSSQPEKRKSPDFFVEVYNTYCSLMPKCTALSDKRRKGIKALQNKWSDDEIVEGFKKAGKSEFLSGVTGWKGCGFDWLTNTNNFLKVIEGNYGNAAPSKKKSPTYGYTSTNKEIEESGMKTGIIELF